MAKKIKVKVRPKTIKVTVRPKKETTIKIKVKPKKAKFNPRKINKRNVS